MSWDVKALASTTGTAPITPQIKNLIGRVRNNNRAARAGSSPQNNNVYRFDDNLNIQTFKSLILCI